MKIIIAILVLAFSGSLASAQPRGANKTNDPPCNESWCDQAQFLYTFCDGQGKFIRKCSSDPNHEPGIKPGDPPLTMMKKATPQVYKPCLDLSGARFRQIIVDPSTPLEPRPGKVVFDILQIDSIAAIAERRWTHLCPAQGPSEEYQYCCLKIRMSTRDADFAPLPADNVRMLTDIYSDGHMSPTHCGINCDRSSIIINQQPAFTGQNDRGAPVRFFYTDNRGDIPWGQYSYASLLAVLTHEMGHWFGFEHTNEPDVNGNTCYKSGSIMEPGYMGNWDYDRDLTPEDRCMFMKAYCCARTTNEVEESLPEEAKGLAFTVIPNPATASITIRIAQPVKSLNAYIRVLDMSGKQVLAQDIPRESQQEILNVEAVPNGIYMVEIVSNGLISGRKMVIQR